VHVVDEGVDPDVPGDLGEGIDVGHLRRPVGLQERVTIRASGIPRG
jgi:hypothetical protein